MTVHLIPVRIRRQCRSLWALNRWVARQDWSEFDVVQGLGRTIYHDVYRAGGGVHAAWRTESARELWPHIRGTFSAVDSLEGWLDYQAMHRAKRVIFNSHLAAHQAQQLLGLPLHKVRVIRNGVNSERFCPDPVMRQHQRRRFGVTGTLWVFIAHGWRRKGLPVAMAAFERMAKRGDVMVIVGADPRGQRWLNRHGFGAQHRFLGEVHDPAPLLQAADVLVHPTRYDAAANIVLESMACGTPAVTTVRDGNSEIVPNGLCVDLATDVDAVCESVEAALVGGNALRERCRTVARAWPVSRNGIAVEELYEELVNER